MCEVCAHLGARYAVPLPMNLREKVFPANEFGSLVLQKDCLVLLLAYATCGIALLNGHEHGVQISRTLVQLVKNATISDSEAVDTVNTARTMLNDMTRIIMERYTE